MKGLHSILFDRVPCWYELTWRPKVGIALRIHEDFVSGEKPISVNAPIVDHFKKEFGFKEFASVFGEDFGFERSLKFLGMSDRFFEYLVPASLCRKTSDKKCTSCEGTGKGWDDRECHFCDGCGKDFNYDYRDAFAVSASLTILLRYMRFPKKETSSKNAQLLCVQTATGHGHYGAPLGGEYGQEVVTFLRKRPNGEVPEMIEAMMNVHERMVGRLRNYDKYSFSAYTQGEDGWLNVSCPGDACGLHPTNGFIGRLDKAYEFTCHNTDQPIQQMTLLASLAALHNLVRNR